MINKDKLKKSSTFCMLPFMHIYGSAGGNMVPCCEAQEIPLNNPGETALESWNNENYKELQGTLETITFSQMYGLNYYVEMIVSN